MFNVTRRGEWCKICSRVVWKLALAVMVAAMGTLGRGASFPPLQECVSYTVLGSTAVAEASARAAKVTHGVSPTSLIRVIADAFECASDSGDGAQITFSWTLNGTPVSPGDFATEHASSETASALLFQPLRLTPHLAHSARLNLTVAASRSNTLETAVSTFDFLLLPLAAELVNTSNQQLTRDNARLQLLREPIASRAAPGSPVRVNLHYDSADANHERTEFQWKVFGQIYSIEKDPHECCEDARCASATKRMKPTVLNLGWMLEIPHDMLPATPFVVEACARNMNGTSRSSTSGADGNVSAEFCDTQEITVSVAALVAQIGDGTSHALVNKENKRIELHAGASYDPNDANLEGTKAAKRALEYRWSCEVGLDESQMVECPADSLVELMSSTRDSICVNGSELFDARLSDSALTFFRFTLTVTKQGRESAQTSRVYRLVPDHDNSLPFAQLDAVTVESAEGKRLDRFAIDVRERVVIGFDDEDLKELISVEYELIEPRDEEHELLGGDLLISGLQWWSADRSDVLPLGLKSGALKMGTDYMFGLIVEQVHAQMNEVTLLLRTRHEARLIMESVLVLEHSGDFGESLLILKARTSHYRSTLRFFFSIRPTADATFGEVLWWCVGGCSGEHTYAENLVWAPGPYEVLIELFDQSDDVRVDSWRSDITVVGQQFTVNLTFVEHLKRSIQAAFNAGDHAMLMSAALQYLHVLGSWRGANFENESALRQNDCACGTCETCFIKDELIPKLHTLSLQSAMNAKLALNFIQLAHQSSNLSLHLIPDDATLRAIVGITSSIVRNNDAYDTHVDIIQPLLEVYSAAIDSAWMRAEALHNESAETTSTSLKRAVLVEMYREVQNQLSVAAFHNSDCGYERSLATQNSSLLFSGLVSCAPSHATLRSAVASATICENAFGGEDLRRRIHVSLFSSPDFWMHQTELRTASFALGRQLITLRLEGYDAESVDQEACVEIKLRLDKSVADALESTPEFAEDPLVPQVVMIDERTGMLRRVRTMSVSKTEVSFSSSVSGGVFGVELVPLSESLFNRSSEASHDGETENEFGESDPEIRESANSNTTKVLVASICGGIGGLALVLVGVAFFVRRGRASVGDGASV
mmetsp:Transcript_2595/g.7050  ORF Transcript_2595/g.7050 Transcript_2595/m.7050 type:complete len:1109 (-) Transcript_2595:253-3579(-)